MRFKLIVNTPKNQAAKCIKTQRKALIGITGRHKVVEEKVTRHNQFYWIVETDHPDKLIKKAAAGEVMIRKFYSGLFHIIGKANKLAEKFDKGILWIRRFIIKRLKKASKYTGSDDSENLISNVEKMSDKELKEFIKIHDKEEMKKLLAGDLITVEEL